MTHLAISPVQWSDFEYIDDVEPINEKDFNCLNEIREILKKYGQLNRLGVALLHSHFPVAEDEILLETANNKERTLTIEPTKQQENSASNIGTIWALGEGNTVEAMGWCRAYCHRGALWHDKSHHREKG